MANSQTEHSKKLRAKNAAEWQKKQLAEGKLKQVSLKLSPEVLAEFDSVCEKLSLSRPQALKVLLEHYQSSQ